MPEHYPRPPGLPADYAPLLADLKARVRAAQLRASVAVNRELVQLYWQIGTKILESQSREGWGAKVVARLAADLRSEFPDMRGFSRTNLLYMRAFAAAYPDASIVQQAAGQLPWFHNVILLSRLKDPGQREWYLRKAVEHGWSRDILEIQIETRLHEREGKAVTNFDRTLPPPQSDLAQQLLKDPYTFDFLTIAGEAKERQLEKGLVDHVQQMLLELGFGFAFVGRQVKFEHAGKLNFYLSLVDDRLRHATDAPTIGLVLARRKNRMTVEYALRDISKPIGVAEWQTRLVHSLPPELKDALPTIEDIEAAMPSPPTSSRAPDPPPAVP